MESNTSKLSEIKRLIVNRSYLSWQNNEKYDILDSASFGNHSLNEEKINAIYEKYPQLRIMDEQYLRNGNYVIGLNIISRHRLLKNLSNYKGKGNAFEESLRYGTYANNIEEVISTLSTIEMGDESVNLSKGIQPNR